MLWAQCTYIGSTVRPRFILFGYMGPQRKGLGCFRVLGFRVLGFRVLGVRVF